MSDSVSGGSQMDYTQCIKPQPQFTPTHQFLQLITMIMEAKFECNGPDKIRNAIAQVSTSCPSVSNCQHGGVTKSLDQTEATHAFLLSSS